MKNCLIILPYIEYLDEAQLKQMESKSELIICADGGQDIALKYGITPDVVIGDFDSSAEKKLFKCEYITYPVEKDITDAEACLNYALEQGATNIIFYGGMGGRFDHTLGALSLLIQGAESFARVRLIDGHNIVEVIRNSSVTLHARSNYNHFGVVPVFQKASGVSITGAKYCVNNIEMYKKNTLGIGNEIVGESATITVNDGYLFVARSK